jgi:transposase
LGRNEDEDRAQRSAQGIDRGFDNRRPVQVISGVERRRRWSREEKAEITAESFVPGVNVSDVARRHSMSLGLLHHWRRLARQHASACEKDFVPILAAEEAGIIRSNAMNAVIEIDVGGVCIRVRGRIDATALQTVIAAVRGS